jgi:hypothetical protein
MQLYLVLRGNAELIFCLADLWIHFLELQLICGADLWLWPLELQFICPTYEWLWSLEFQLRVPAIDRRAFLDPLHHVWCVVFRGILFSQ